MLSITRRYTFAAAHKLWNPEFTEAENKACFGKCTHMHGHNYVLYVSVSGMPDPVTGMIADIVVLDALVQEHILSWVDHRYLDEDFHLLEGKSSTVENLVQAIFDALLPVIPRPARLSKVRLVETENNWATVRAD